MVEPRRDVPDAQKKLSALVAQCIERMEDEGPAVLEELCAAHPEHALKLRAHLARLQRVGLVGEMPAAADLPERLGSFRILSLLGRGGMGVVYLAEQEGLQRRVALKLVRPEHLFFPGARQRFKREIEAAARLQHPGIIPVFAAGEEQGVPFYAMEYVRGAALEEVLGVLAGSQVARLTGADMRRAVEQVVARRDDALPGPDVWRGAGTPRSSGSSAGGAQLFAGTWTEAALRIARQVALALQHAHEAGVLHRDVKPSNIMVTPEGRVLLLDFGLAAAEGSTRLTRSGSQVGSLAWMSPEQVRGLPDDLDARTDVYSLGATLHELLALRSPFVAASVDETRQRILEGRPALLRELNPAVPRDAETVCLKAMDADRERRYADAAELAADLGNALELRPVQARRPGAWLKARRWAQRHPAAAVAAVLGTLLVVGGPAGYGVVQGRAAERERTLNEQLVDTNRQLDGALTGLKESTAKLERSLEEERRQRESAQRSFDRSLEAVDSLLTDVGADELRDVPQFERVRSRLLERALAFYRELEAERPADTEVRMDQASTHRSIADLLVELGRNDEARDMYAQTLEELRATMAEHPEDHDLRFTYASTLAQFALTDFLAGRLDEAEANWETAHDTLLPLMDLPDRMPGWVHTLSGLLGDLALIAHERGDDERALQLYLEGAERLEPLCALHPEQTLYASLLASQYASAATLAAQLGQADEAEALHRDAWERLAELVAREPWNRRTRIDACEAASNFGLLLLSRPDREEAERVLRDGFEIASGLAQEFPQDARAQMQCAVLGLNLATELLNQERAAEAEQLATEGCGRLEALVQQFPDNPQYANFLGFSCTASAAIHLKLGDVDRSAQDAARGVVILRELLASTQSAVVGASLATALCQSAECVRRQGDPAAAFAMVEEALTLVSGRPDILYQAAETLAGCHAAAVAAAGDAADDARGSDSPGAAAGDPPGSDPTVHAAESAAAADARQEAADLATAVHDRALVVLDLALQSGFTDFDRLRTHSAFATLRGLPGFEALLRESGG